MTWARHRLNYTDVYYGDRLSPEMALMSATATQKQISDFRLFPGDVVITKDSETADDIGVAAYVDQSADDMVCGYHLAVLRPRRGVVDGRYLFWSVVSDHARSQFSAGATGVTRFGLRIDVIASTEVLVPSLSEQRAIADFLDTETARIDAVTAKKRRLIELLEERWRAAARNRMTELSGTYGDLPLKRFVECLDARRVPLSSEERADRPGPFPYFGASGIIDSIDGYLFDETLVLLGEDGAQLADPTCEISFVVEGKSWVNNHAHVLRSVAADPYFLALHLSTFDRTAFISGSTREKITQGEMTSIPVPALEEEAQRNEALELVRVKRVAESVVRRLTEQIELLAERRPTLITAAVTGNLDVARHLAEEAS